jgi:hypothetical protein
MGESFEEFIAAERALELRTWARAEAAALPAAELAAIDVFQLRDDIADCQANDQPTTAALDRAILDRAIQVQVARVRPPRGPGEAER